MCCGCDASLLENCNCSLYEEKCEKPVCCWCCVYQRWIKFESEGKIYSTLIADIELVSSKEKHLKVAKKFVKDQLKDIEHINAEFSKYKSKRYIQMVDGDNDLDTLVNEIENDLGQKIRCQLNEWEVYIEMCNVFLDFQDAFVSKLSYLNMFEMSEGIFTTLFEMAQLFSKVLKTEQNMSFIATTKEKFVDLEGVLTKFQENLNHKISTL
ncbi:hypothetical protein SCHIN_v1c05130 [Spiroplasma chinense]|uniref:Uncharacterized protein n=1 Tax=Spiroplasma chinense TaxID=216932 RepID=A0A5B9Y422_9MOLU|nr:hypothetical protein [Spiroplasma chinense]QEH61710.1 hypothetical protein SCHIN_v1c05130 [Spiroplasma chinense]